MKKTLTELKKIEIPFAQFLEERPTALYSDHCLDVILAAEQGELDEEDVENLLSPIVGQLMFTLFIEDHSAFNRLIIAIKDEFQKQRAFEERDNFIRTGDGKEAFIEDANAYNMALGAGYRPVNVREEGDTVIYTMKPTIQINDTFLGHNLLNDQNDDVRKVSDKISAIFKFGGGLIR